MAQTVVGVLRSQDEADSAVRELERAGFTSDEVGVAAPGQRTEPDYGRHLAFGIVVGTLLGALIGAGLAVIPAFLAPGGNHEVGAATLVLVLGGAMAGGATGGLAGVLISMAGSTDRTLHYEQEAASGRFVVSVNSDRPAEAYEVLRRSGAIEASPIDAPVGRPRHRPVGHAVTALRWPPGTPSPLRRSGP